jgi:hypothetical protein
MSTTFPEPREMLRRHLVARGHAALRAGAAHWATHPAAVRETFAGYYGDLPAVLAATPLHARVVGHGRGPGFRYENILFESHPGWEVNATLFLPADLPPPYPPIIMSVGHSAKTRPSYQLPCQYFARAGFAALTYDPPGMAGEKQPGNDHFADGVRCHLTGDTSSRYFVGDALRGVDYLLGRSDIDARHGIAATGVSGGGHTSVFAALLDDRISVIGPSCCFAPQGSLVLDLCYSSCPETLMPGRLRDGLDDFDLCCALAPRPLLLMAGQVDEIFDIAATTRDAARLAAHYATAGAAARFRFLADEGGHAYTLRQARVFAGWLRQHWGLPGMEILPAPNADDFPLLEPAAMSCRPNTSVHMRSLTLARATVLAETCPATPAVEVIRRVNNFPGTLPPPARAGRSPAQRTWFHTWQEWLVTTEPGITVPVTTLDPGSAAPALWHFDEAGRSDGLARGGWLTEAIGHLDRDGPKAGLLTADLRGRGETAMALRPFEAVNWGAPDRFAAYVGAALGDAPEAMRLRDAWQLAQVFPSQPRTVLSATGAAGPVALHLAALLPGRFTAVVLYDAPASYAALLDTGEFAWPHDLVLPGVLRHYDLPALAAITGCPVHWLNPRDGARRPATGMSPGSRRDVRDAEHLALIRELLYV